jgi:hypothetical protein
MAALVDALLPGNWTTAGFGSCLSGGKKNGSKALVYGAVGGGVVAVALIAGAVLYMRRRKSEDVGYAQDVYAPI